MVIVLGVDKDIELCVLEQIYFDEKGLGINHDMLLVEYLSEVFGITTEELTIGG